MPAGPLSRSGGQPLRSALAAIEARAPLGTASVRQPDGRPSAVVGTPRWQRSNSCGQPIASTGTPHQCCAARPET
jgi:hypothetical protein